MTSPAAMRRTQALRVLAVVVCLAGCNSGGGSANFPPIPAWFKFRQNVNNTGAGIGAVGTSNGLGRWAVQIDAGDPHPVSASPAIAADGTIYIGSEGGTLAAVTRSGTILWRINSCDICPEPLGTSPLGALRSSPLVYDFNGTRSLYLGTADGRFVAFQDNGKSATCTACFVPQVQDPTIESVAFDSSPTFTTHPLLLNVTGLFVGATVLYSAPPPTPPAEVGKLYALNSTGSLQWEFPPAGAAPIAPVSSSPALGVGNILYFITNDALLLSVSPLGAEVWRARIGAGTVSGGLAPSAVTTQSRVFAVSAEGRTTALTLDGQPVWAAEEDDGFASSLALGGQIVLTPTPAPTAIATSTAPPGPTATSTPTPTPTVASATLFGMTKSGLLVAREANLGTLLPPSGPLPTPVDGDVVASPTVSDDDYLVFATSTGMLYVVSTATGLAPAGWPVALTNGVPIRSSPSIGVDGTIYVGADDGQLYAVGNQ